MSHKDILKLLMPLELDENNEKDMAIEGKFLDEAQQSITRILANAFADSAHELLPSWEKTLGIVPPENASITARVANCVLKIRERGGLSRKYFKTLASAMGYTIEIVEPWPFMAGMGAAGDMLYVPEIIWQWRVDVKNTDTPVYYFRAGESGAGDPLMSFGVQELEDVFINLKPAHTFVYFTYT
jgi:uncharacterized protein YmfQ (DUF2313 family)